MRKLILATAAGLILPSLAWATDARLTYQTASGMWADAAVASLTCGVDSSGVPQICDTGGSSSSDAVALRLGVEAATSTDARIVYQTKSGMWASAIPTVPVCGVTDGIPQICTFGGSSSEDLSSYLTVTAAQAGYAQLASQNVFTSEQHFAYAYFADPDNDVQRDAKFGDKGIAVTGGTKTDTLTVTGASSVIDTGPTDSSKTILNTESAAARFVSSTTAASTYETIAGMSSYALKTNGTLTTPSITKPSIDGAH